MTLHHHPDFPSGRYYVLKLHRDADPARGGLRGRVEHVASGDHFDFASAPALLAVLARHLEDTAAQPTAGASRA